MPDFTSLPDAALLALLRTEEDSVPLAAAEEIVRRGDQVEDALIDILNEDALWEDEGKARWALVHATRLLAIGGRPDSFDFVVEAVHRAYDSGLDEIWKDARELLAAYGPSHADALVDLIRAEQDCDDFHACCLEALAIHAARGRFPTARLFDLTVSIFEKEARTFDLEESAERILSLWIRNGAEAEVAHSFGEDLATAQRHNPSIWGGARLFVEKPDEWFLEPDLWGFYAEPASKRRSRRSRHARENEVAERHCGEPGMRQPPEPIRSPPKPGRNDACSCGSGKKFKKCCEGKQ